MKEDNITLLILVITTSMSERMNNRTGQTTLRRTLILLKFFLRHICNWKNVTPKRVSLGCGVSIIHSCTSQWDVMMSDCPHQKQCLLLSSSFLLLVYLAAALCVCTLLSSGEMRQTTPPSPLLLLTSSTSGTSGSSGSTVEDRALAYATSLYWK
jgi:hypothetical protein